MNKGISFFRNLLFLLPVLVVSTLLAAQSSGDLPLVNLGPPQLAVEGNTVTVGVFLSDANPTYPVEVGFTVTSDLASAGEDYSILGNSQTIVIDSGNQADIQLQILVDDTTSSEVLENIFITLTSATNAEIGGDDESVIHILEGNIPPIIEGFEVVQEGITSTNVILGYGEVTVRVNAFDFNADQTITFAWGSTETASLSALTDIDGIENNSEFVFEAIDLTPGSYQLNIQVFDSSGQLAFDTLRIELLEGLPVGVSRQELADSDDDGIPYYLDDNDQIADNEIAFSASNSTSIKAETGITLKVGSLARAAHPNTSTGVLLSEADIVTAGGILDYNYENSNLINFIASGKPAGHIYHIVIPVPETIADGLVYRIFLDLFSFWTNFRDDGNVIRGQIASTKSTNNRCPDPDSSIYEPPVIEEDDTEAATETVALGLVTADDCIQLSIIDGGSNDSDSLLNGRIHFVGGLGDLLVSAIELEVSSINLMIGDTATLTATATDTEGMGIENIDITIGQSNISVLSKTTPGLTDANGQIQLELTANSLGYTVVSASVAGVTDALNINILAAEIEPEGGGGSLSLWWLLVLGVLVLLKSKPRSQLIIQ